MATLTFTTPNADYTGYPTGAVHIEIGTIAAATSNVSNITLKVAQPGGTIPANLVPFKLWLSDSATGVGQTGTTASGTVTAKSSSGTVLDTLTAKKSLVVQTNTAGSFILEITDSAKTGFYVCAQMPHGPVVVSRQLVTADYG